MAPDNRDRPALRLVPAAPPAPPGAAAPDRDLIALVSAARAGDAAAWSDLVRRYDRCVRASIRSFRLSPTDVDDVAQATWLELFEAIDGLREPAAVRGWLTTTARRKALRVLQGPLREELSADPHLGDCPDPDEPCAGLLAGERRDALADALATLPERHRRLMTLLVVDPALTYTEISAATEMPVGSIGPIRARALDRLRRHSKLRSLES